MGKGPGQVQRAIAALIAAEPDGAWSYDELVRAVYRQPPTRARLSAVGRALKQMALPGTWTFRRSGFGDRRRWLYDSCSLASARKAHPDHSEHRVVERVEKARRWRDALPAERIDMEIADLRTYMGLIGVGLQRGGDQKACTDSFNKAVAQIAELERQKADLTATVSRYNLSHRDKPALRAPGA
jgi:hypothetical protein